MMSIHVLMGLGKFQCNSLNLTLYIVFSSLSFNQVCDGKLDCKHGSDEKTCGRIWFEDSYEYMHSDPDKSK